jgi:hypothetical protein
MREMTMGIQNIKGRFRKSILRTAPWQPCTDRHGGRGKKLEKELGPFKGDDEHANILNPARKAIRHGQHLRSII